MNAQVSLNTQSMEDTLLMREWGKWVRTGAARGRSYPRWVIEMQKGWREDPKELLVDIDDDYGMWIDQKLLTLEERQRQIIVSMYAYRKSVSTLARIFRTSPYTIRGERDSALSYLFGALNERKIA